jgi:hypothetical protein
MISSRYINPSDGAKAEAVHVWPQNLHLYFMILILQSLQIFILPVDYKSLVIQAAAQELREQSSLQAGAARILVADLFELHLQPSGVSRCLAAWL